MKVNIEDNTLYSIHAEGEKNITLPAVKSIYKRCIKDEGVESVIIPEGVEEISSDAFSYKTLKRLVIPSSVKIIENWIIRDCKSDVTIKMSSKIPYIKTQAFVVDEQTATVTFEIDNDYLNLPDGWTTQLNTLIKKETDDYTVVLKTYSKEEYINIKKQSLEYMPTFNNSGNSYEYSGNDRTEYMGETIYSLPYVPEQNVIVYNGKFVGIGFKEYKHPNYVYTVIPTNVEEFKTIRNDSSSSEWGYYKDVEYCKLTKIDASKPRVIKTFKKIVKI